MALLHQDDRSDSGTHPSSEPEVSTDNRTNLDVIIITRDEQANLPHCLKALQHWAKQIFVVDSGSTDRTPQIAREYGAELIHHDWQGYAAQKNWALDHLPLTADWVLLIDADEVITDPLKSEIETIVDQPVDRVAENGYFLNRITFFLDQPIRHCGYFPSWNMRLFKRGQGRFEDRLVHEHIVMPDPVGYLAEPMTHHDRRGLEYFYAKHNRYSTLEAQQLYSEITQRKTISAPANITAETRRRRWLKRHALRWIPLPGLWRFIYMYIYRLGFLDGNTGYRFCRFIAHYDSMVAFKLRALLGNSSPQTQPPNPPPLPLSDTPAPNSQPPIPNTPPQDASRQTPTPLDNDPIQMHPESSPWTLGGKITRALWMMLGRPLFRLSFHNWYAYRNLILRCFGATIGKRVSIRPTVHIEIPWQLDIHDDATIGDRAILYSLGKITIGPRVIISQYAHLCAGSHDYTDPTFPLLRPPITIERDAWIGADTFVGPGVTVGHLAVLGARSSAYRDLPPKQVCIGNPAKPVKPRELKAR